MHQIKIEDESCVGAARRFAIALSRQLAFSETEQGKVGIIVSEMVSNLVKYAPGKGELLLQAIEINKVTGIELLSIDKGVGIANVAQCLRDGYSTQKTAGTGLGAISRLASFFSLYSIPNMGTVLLARCFPKLEPEKILFELGCICLPIKGETACGDAWSVQTHPNRTVYLMSDGLGHGIEAAHASHLAQEAFKKTSHLSPAAIIAAIDTALQKSRGAAIAIAEINYEQGYVRFAGLGNISGQVWLNDKVYHLIGKDGITGTGQFKARESTYPWHKEAILIMHSDGLSSRWSLKDYPGLTGRHPAIIAGALYRDHVRGLDDVTVLVVKEK